MNWISTFLGYLMPKPSLKEDNNGTIQPIVGRIRGGLYLSQWSQSVSECNSKTGVKSHYDVAVQHVSHYTMGTPPNKLVITH